MSILSWNSTAVALGLICVGCASKSAYVGLPAKPDSPHMVKGVLEERTEPTILADSNESVVQLVDHLEIEPIADVHKDANGVLTLDYLEATALANNPTLQQASATISKASGLQYQVGLRPNPTISYTATQVADKGTDQHVLSIDQEIVRGDKLEWNQDVLHQVKQTQLWEAEVQRERVLTDVRIAYYNAITAQQQLEVILDIVRVVRHGVELAEQRQQAGITSKVEVLQAKILLSEMELAQTQAKVRFHAAWTQLTAVVGVPDLKQQQLIAQFDAEAIPKDWERTYAQLVAASPEMTTAQMRVSTARSKLHRQEVQAIPNLMTQLGVGYDNGTNSGMLNLQLGVPLPIYNDNSGNISAAQADYIRALHNVRRVEMSIQSRLADVSQDYDQALATVLQYRDDILPNVKDSLQLSEQAYSVGELDFLQVQTVRRTYYDAQREYVESQNKLSQANGAPEGFIAV